jgi:leucyl-tRNA synthetase
VYYKKFSAKELQQKWKDIECSKFREDPAMSTAGVSTDTVNLESNSSTDSHPYRNIGDAVGFGGMEDEYFKPDFLRNEKLFAKKATNLFMDVDATGGLCELD